MKHSPMRLLRALGLIGCAMTGGRHAAHAQIVTTFDFSFTFQSAYSSSPVNVSSLGGSFKAAASGGAYTITSMSGTFGGYSVTLMAPGAFASNDNTLYSPANPGYFTLGGVSFIANGVDYNLYYYNGIYGVTRVDSLNAGGVYSGNVWEVGAPGPTPGLGATSLAALCLAHLATRAKSRAALATIVLRPRRGLFSRRRSAGAPV